MAAIDSEAQGPPQHSENVTVPEALLPTQPGTLDHETQTQTPSRKSRIPNPSTRALARCRCRVYGRGCCWAASTTKS